MNKSEQKRIGEIADQLDNAAGMFESMLEELATFASTEQERYDGMSERAQEGDRGQKIEQLASTLQNSSDRAQQAFDELTETASELRALLEE